LNFLVLPRIAFITGRIALIFQKPLFFTTFFRNFASEKKSVITITKFLYDEDQQTKQVAPMSWRNAFLFPSVGSECFCCGTATNTTGDRKP
jgi:hypothetical protein